MNDPLSGMFGKVMNPMAQLVQKFNQFQQGFRGDANQQIQQLMNAGKVNQQQYNQAVQMAQQFQKMMGGK